MNGIKLGRDGSIERGNALTLVVDSDNPFWKCDLKSDPLHYGLLQAKITGVPAFGKKILLSIPHRYDDAVSFLAQWNYPAGTKPGDDFLNQTFGVGSFETFTGSAIVKVFTTSTTFNIVADNSVGASPMAAFDIEYRFYVFAESVSTLLV